MKKSEILAGALRIADETGHGYVRDIDSDILANPSKAPWPMVLEQTAKDWTQKNVQFVGRLPQANFDGDTFHGEVPVRGFQTKRQRELSRQRYNNMSITRKKRVRDIRKDLAKSIKKLKAIV